jgi:CheY-like chemotaxis protein
MFPSILVVGSEPDLAEIVQIVLEDAGYTVHAAATGREALALIAEGYRPSVLVLDLDLSDMNCLELADEARRFRGLAALPAVVLTGFPNAPRMLGLTRFLEKPFLPDDLLASIRDHGVRGGRAQVIGQA